MFGFADYTYRGSRVVWSGLLNNSDIGLINGWSGESNFRTKLAQHGYVVEDTDFSYEKTTEAGALFRLQAQVLLPVDFGDLSHVAGDIAGIAQQAFGPQATDQKINVIWANTPNAQGQVTQAPQYNQNNQNNSNQCSTWDIPCHLGFTPGAAAGTGLLTGALIVIAGVLLLKRL